MHIWPWPTSDLSQMWQPTTIWGLLWAQKQHQFPHGCLISIFSPTISPPRPATRAAPGRCSCGRRASSCWGSSWRCCRGSGGARGWWAISSTCSPSAWAPANWSGWSWATAAAGARPLTQSSPLTRTQSSSLETEQGGGWWNIPHIG